MRIPFSILITTLLFSCNGQTPLKQNKDENTLLWEISGNGLKTPSYLYGTFHLLCKEDIVISNQLKQALQQSHTIYMELDMDDPAMLMSGLLLMNMKDDKKLKDLYTEEEYKKIETFFKDSLHTPIALMQRMKPFFLSSLIYPQIISCKNMSGVEEQLIRLAKESKKEIKGLETMVFQAAIFDSIPYEDQAKELLSSIDSMEKNRSEFKKMVKAYKNQQLDEIEKSIKNSEFGVKENEDILLTQRNRNWIKQLQEIMIKENVFVAVGAGHLVGSNGLIDLLKQKGYTLRPLYNR